VERVVLNALATKARFASRRLISSKPWSATLEIVGLRAIGSRIVFGKDDPPLANAKVELIVRDHELSFAGRLHCHDQLWVW
jgi:hypothetical protein